MPHVQPFLMAMLQYLIFSVSSMDKLGQIEWASFVIKKSTQKSKKNTEKSNRTNSFLKPQKNPAKTEEEPVLSIKTEQQRLLL